MFHEFTSTMDAYDKSQWCEDVTNGDILWIPSEAIIGVADAWPYAITEERGHLHGLHGFNTLKKTCHILGNDDTLIQEILGAVRTLIFHGMSSL